MKYKITIEVIPNQLHYKSLRQKVSSEEWNKIKQEIFKKERYKCWICGSIEKPLEAHEFFDYNEKKGIQKLIAIHHLCKPCHHIKHFGFSNISLNEKEIERLRNHFCKVNCCSINDFKKHEKQVFNIWNKRNKIGWKQDFSIFLKTT